MAEVSEMGRDRVHDPGFTSKIEFQRDLAAQLINWGHKVKWKLRFGEEISRCTEVGEIATHEIQSAGILDFNSHKTVRRSQVPALGIA